MDRNTARGHRPGYRVSQRMLTDDEAREALADAYQEYEDRLVNAYKNTSDATEGSPCKAPTGEAGIWQTVAGRLVCTPQAAARTSDTKLLDQEFDDGEDFYAAYDRRIANQYKGGE